MIYIFYFETQMDLIMAAQSADHQLVAELLLSGMVGEEGSTMCLNKGEDWFIFNQSTRMYVNKLSSELVF